MESTKISRAELVAMIANGAFFTVEFVKKDGSVRVLNGRTGVAKHTVGGVRTSDPSQYLMVWETGHADGHEAYRNVNIQTIRRVTFKGTTYVPADLAA
jgi:hypothetical protein